jgi:hypothetical protein
VRALPAMRRKAFKTPNNPYTPTYLAAIRHQARPRCFRRECRAGRAGSNATSACLLLSPSCRPASLRRSSTVPRLRISPSPASPRHCPIPGPSRSGPSCETGRLSEPVEKKGHNLDLEFNSLDAKREACEAYIKSQAHEGWRLRRRASLDLDPRRHPRTGLPQQSNQSQPRRIGN